MHMGGSDSVVPIWERLGGFFFPPRLTGQSMNEPWSLCGALLKTGDMADPGVTECSISGLMNLVTAVLVENALENAAQEAESERLQLKHKIKGALPTLPLSGQGNWRRGVGLFLVESPVGGLHGIGGKRPKWQRGHKTVGREGGSLFCFFCPSGGFSFGWFLLWVVSLGPFGW